jgi:hypothetical protein
VEGRLVGVHFRGETETFSALIFPRQRPLTLLVRVGCTDDEALGNDERRDIRSGLLHCYAAEERSWTVFIAFDRSLILGGAGL